MALVVVLAGCSSNGTPTPAPSTVPPSVATQVWSLVDGFVDWPALPATPPGNWSLNLHQLFPSSDGDVPNWPNPPGILAGLNASAQLVAYRATTGQQAWQVAQAPLTSPEQANDQPIVESVQNAGLHLIAVTRDLASGASQLDLYDATTGRYLYGRSGKGVSTPMLLDDQHALFDLTDTSSDGGLDEVDARTGTLVWHNPGVAACSVYVGKILCDTIDAKSIALLDPATGATKWTVPFQETAQGVAFSTSAVIGDEGYFTNGSSDTLTAINLASGHVDWQRPTGIDSVQSIVPLDASHIAVGGLVHGTSGSTELLVSMAIRDGATSTIYAGTDSDGSDTSNGGLVAIRLGGNEYLALIDPDGSIRTFGSNGHQVAVLAADCATFADVVGDTLGCDSTNGYTLYALPGLGVRGNFDAGNSTSISVVGNVLLANIDDTVKPIKP